MYSFIGSDSVLLTVSSNNSWKVQHIRKNLQMPVKYMRKRLRIWFSGLRMNKPGQQKPSIS